MPRGNSFCSREDFERGFQVFSAATGEGRDLSGASLLRAIAEEPRAWLVLRCVLGMSPGEAAYVAVEAASTQGETLVVDQTAVRELDARARRGEQLLFDTAPRRQAERTGDALLRRLVPLLGEVLLSGPPTVTVDKVHRLDKVDTAGGQLTLMQVFAEGVTYSELLYERLLGRPYASHRDSVSGIVGDLIERAVGELLDRYRIDGRATRARERVPGFEQAPDFLIPTEEPEVIIEAKLTEDDGTARDKVARVQTLRAYEDARPQGERRQIVAVVDGRGFSHRMADLDRLLRTCDGHVYTLAELDLLVADGGPLAPYRDTRA
jgi:hypothetical protein